MTTHHDDDAHGEAVRTILVPALLAVAALLMAGGLAYADAPETSPLPVPRPVTTEGGFAPVHPVRALSAVNAMLNDGDALMCRGRIVLALRGACAETAEARNTTPATVGQIGGTE